MPRVSVLMPAFNAERFLGDAIESILSQSFDDFEFLIYDDGSTDATARIAGSYAARDPRIRILSAENRGIAFALNALIAEARGEYLARMDADDISLPDRFEKQVAFLDTHPDCTMVGGQEEWMDEDGYLIGPRWAPTRHEDLEALLLRGKVRISHPTVMLRTTAVRQVGGYDKTLRSAQDFDLWLRLAEIGRLANLPDIVLRYRLAGDSISARKADEQKSNAINVLNTARQRRNLPETPFEGKDWRPTADKDSQFSFLLRYGWIAWSNNYRDTWRRYAGRALYLKPLETNAWKLLLLGMIRRPSLVSRSGTGQPGSKSPPQLAHPLQDIACAFLTS